MTDLAFGITADPTGAKSGIDQTSRALDELKSDLRDVRRESEAGANSLRGVGQKGTQGISQASTGVGRLREDLKTMNRTLDAVNDNFQELGPEAAAELAVAERAVGSLRRALRRAHGDIDRLDIVSGNARREVVKDAVLMRRAIDGITAASARARVGVASIGGGVRAGVNRARGAAAGLGLGFGALGGALALPSLANRADELTVSRARLGLIPQEDEGALQGPNVRAVPAQFSQARQAQDALSDSAETLNDRWRDLFDRAQDLRVPITALSDLTFQLGLSTEGLGDNATKTDRIIELLGKNLSIAGASGVQADNGVRQFIQALQRGTVQAEEFNSIQENIPTVLKAVADGLGITFAQLREEMLAGTLTAERFTDGLLKSGAEVDKQFASLPRTIRQATIQLGNVFDGLIDDTNRQNALTQQLVDLLDKVRGALEGDSGQTFFASVIQDINTILTDLGKLSDFIQDPTLGKFLGLFPSEPSRTGGGVVGGISATIDAFTTPTAPSGTAVNNLFTRRGGGADVQPDTLSIPLRDVRNSPDVRDLLPFPRPQGDFPILSSPNNLPSVTRPAQLTDQQKQLVADGFDNSEQAGRQTEALESNLDELQEITSRTGESNQILVDLFGATERQTDLFGRAIGELRTVTGRSFADLRDAFVRGIEQEGTFDGPSFTSSRPLNLIEQQRLENFQGPEVAARTRLEELQQQLEIAENDLTIASSSPETTEGNVLITRIENAIADIEGQIAEQQNILALAAQTDEGGRQRINPLLTNVGVGRISGFRDGGFGQAPFTSTGLDSVRTLVDLNPGEIAAFGDAAIHGLAGQRPAGDVNVTVGGPTIIVQSNENDSKATVENIAQVMSEFGDQILESVQAEMRQG